jgi:aspartate/methionine/tyrosine aminotransferase
MFRANHNFCAFAPRSKQHWPKSNNIRAKAQKSQVFFWTVSLAVAILAKTGRYDSDIEAPMNLPERFSNLPDYAFPRLRKLLDHHQPGGDVLHMSIGEPKHAFPDWVPQVLAEHAHEFGRYPPNPGSPELLEAIAEWFLRRYGQKIDGPSQVMALNGSREGLFNAMLALCPEQKNGQQPLVLIPNPFYQVYSVGSVAAGAEPFYVDAPAANGFLPDYASLAAETLDRAAVMFICSPSNPQGAVASEDYLLGLLKLAEKHDFIVFSDECYSEIYDGTAPPSALQVALAHGLDPERVVIFNSLSKRSNLAGLRSGFAASGPRNVAQLNQLRNYGGAPLPLPLQRVAERVWADEAHVIENRRLYSEKFRLAEDILGNLPGITLSRAGFFLWLDVGNGEEAALKLWRETGVRVLPGAYLGRDWHGQNPGQEFIRVAMVAPRAETERGLHAIRSCLFG